MWKEGHFIKEEEEMDKGKNRTMLMVLGMLGSLLLLAPASVRAVPSFARQTGMSCDRCHTAFPELTPFGRAFKLGGYVFSTSAKPYQFPPPIAGMAQLSYTHTGKAQPSDSVDDNWASHFLSSGNDNANVPQQLSLFYAGRIYGRLGAFVQGTFDGASNMFFLDTTDIRFAGHSNIDEKPLIYGFTVNNNPTVEDVWNTTPAFSFPYATSSVAPTPAAAAIVDGTLAQQVGGIGAYAFWNNLIYADVSVYRTARSGITEPLGGGTPTDTEVDGAAPYWRVALQHQWNQHSVSLGTYGMVTDVFPAGNTSGPSDCFTDVALDAQYQYITDRHRFSAQTTWIHENQDWDASFPLESAANQSDSLDTFRINFNYYYRSHLGEIGGSLGYFSTTGDKDVLLYSPDPVDGSRTGSPNSNGFILEADFLPWEKFKLTVQYIIYDRFNGASSNYDGFGRDASDNNTLYLLVWYMF
jgi:hypothetical protein